MKMYFWVGLFFWGTAFAQSPHGANFLMDCSGCHTATSWTVNPSKIFFSHYNTKYYLTGQHINVACKQCHTSMVFSEAKTNCAGCHRDMHKNSVGTDCQRCHTTENWIVNKTNLLHQSTRFPLVGIHAKTDCGSCHSGYKELNFAVQEVTCYSCHSAAYIAAKLPNHIESNFSKDCDQCHRSSASSWIEAQFRHEQFQGVACNTCHSANYAGTTNPNHAASNYPKNCSPCHSTTAWKPATLDHSLTQFPLTGVHLSTSCEKCHVNNVYSGTSVDCYACHQTAYSNATNPNHISAGYPTNCKTCHTTTAWVPSNFNHTATGFTLEGGHTTVACAQCHSGTIGHIDPACKTCHTPKYTATTNPSHTALSISLDCATCHTTVKGWKPAQFPNHAAYFAFAGAHIAIANNCASCHNGSYPVQTARVCDNCHSAKFNATTIPPHSLVAYSRTCTICHTQTAWTPAPTYAHPTYNYKVKHSSKKCNECHTTNTAGYVPQCISCHQSDFNEEHKSSARKDCWASGCHTSPNNFDHRPVRAKIRID